LDNKITCLTFGSDLNFPIDMTNRLRSLILAFSLVAISSVVYAQLPPEPEDQNGPSPVPVDGGASLLLAGGAIAGFKKLRSSKKVS
jgi:hypothetical protein